VAENRHIDEQDAEQRKPTQDVHDWNALGRLNRDEGGEFIERPKDFEPSGRPRYNMSYAFRSIKEM
jgi:hypothetical protein